MFDTIHEECGVFGAFCTNEPDEKYSKYIYYGLYALHIEVRKVQESVVNDDGVFSSYKDIGL